METLQILTKSDLEKLHVRLDCIENKIEGKYPEYLNAAEIKKKYTISTSTLWRLEGTGALRAKRLPGSRKKFYLLSEFVHALENDE